MKLKLLTSTLIALFSFPALADNCPNFSEHKQYINGDEIQKDGAFYKAKNDPQKGTDVSSSWFWESIPECRRGLTTVLHDHPQRFRNGITSQRILSGDGMTNYTEINPNIVYVANKMEGGQHETLVRATDVTLKNKFSVGRTETSLKAGSLKFEEFIYGKQSATTVDAESVTTSLVEADKMLMTPMAIIGGRNVMAYIQSLEARISDLESKLAQK
ncbi:hypothetical protein [Vibrio penaeicida]|uniref:Uncharacterized protein n=1 Tax=Vibrio penaeicida TaxID=104609 RepID=A0AAV5NVM8_9VIBR|nr:hypothetical protein [Vibrio penaeicida]RTZ23364.1 hypothetical protein EKN09_09345 [Vibrio penaeicida]GLQ74303.1 hypothetical protein GCM10007932_36640 [Vibrio penaeicida]